MRSVNSLGLTSTPAVRPGRLPGGSLRGERGGRPGRLSEGLGSSRRLPGGSLRGERGGGREAGEALWRPGKLREAWEAPWRIPEGGAGGGRLPGWRASRLIHQTPQVFVCF